VTVLEAEEAIGGASRLSVGVLLAAGTEIQEAAGVVDDPADMYQEHMLLNQFVTQPGPSRRLVYESAAAISWLTGIGVRFMPHLMQGGWERVPRAHVADGGGEAMIDALHRQCVGVGALIELNTRVDGLLVEEERVVGVAAGEVDVAAAAVVLATGGFGGNPALVAEYLPSIVRHGDWVFTISPPSSNGDALALAAQVDGRIVGHDWSVGMLTPPVRTGEFDAFLPGWMLVLDPSGYRLCDETAAYGVTIALARAVGGRVFGIFDEPTLTENGSPGLPTFKAEYPPGRPLPAHVYTTERLRELIADGRIVSAETLEELARMLELPVTTATGSVERYNELVGLGEDRDYLKDARFLRAVKTPPFYGVELRTAGLGVTVCGIQTDEAAHVVSTSATTVAGLFAAGECAATVLGPRYLGPGISLTNTIVYGRIAGDSAAAFALGRD
jgi:fumarate reductase flavoprotein subunit